MPRCHSLPGRLAVALALPLVAACSAPTSEPSPPTAVAAAPTAVPAAAVAAAPPTVVVAPTAPPPPTAVPTPVLAKRTVQALAYTHDDKGHPQGSIHPLSVSVQPGPREQEFRLGFFETDVGQLGPMWRAAGWMATSVGALETGKDINTLRVSWETNGFIDGPSAGGLMTSTFIAAINGDDIKKEVAFTGTINPDGSIGPVGGIQYKLEAAAKEGKKLLLIPIGQRYDVDEETGATVDVVQKGQLAGVKVQEVSTLDEAYEALTGKTLARVPAGSKIPDLTPDAYNRVRPKVLDWIAEYQDALGRFKTVDPRVRDLFSDNVVEMATMAKAADKALSEGSVAAAYSNAQQATVGMNAIALGARAIEVLVQTEDFDAAQQALVQSAGASRVAPLVERLKVLQPNTPEDAVLTVNAWSNALGALALDAAVSREMSAFKAADNDTDRFTHLFEAAVYQSTQRYAAKAAEDVLTFNVGRSSTTGKKVDVQALDSWTGVFKRAAEANLSYFDAIVLDQAAQAAGVRIDVAKARFEANSFPYLMASYGASPGAQDYLAKTMGKGAALSYAQLGMSVGSFLSSSELVAEHYSLGATTDSNGNVTGFARDRALTSMLDAASDRARERIAAVDKAGGDSSLSVVLFQAGKAAREGSADQKLSALRSFWDASTYGRLQLLMGEGPKT